MTRPEEAETGTVIERHVNRFLLRDLQRLLKTADVIEWLDQEGQRLASYGVTHEGFVEFTPKLLRERRVTRIVTGAISRDAYVDFAGDGYWIFVRRGVPEARRRFVIAHEIGHTLWFKEGSTSPVSVVQLSGRDPGIEYLCDRFAAALLMPRGEFLRALAEQDCSLIDETPPLHMVPYLARRFRVAEQAISRRMLFDLSRRGLAVVALRTDSASHGLPFFREGDASWCVSWCALPQILHEQTIDGFKVPFKTPGRRVPSCMIPHASEATTSLLPLDARLWRGVTPLPKVAASVPLERLPEAGFRLGYVARSGPCIYLALSCERERQPDVASAQKAVSLPTR
jgi:hypothetical protein